MQSKAFPWLKNLPQRAAEDFLVKLSLAMGDEEDDRSYEEVMTLVDTAVLSYQAAALATSQAAAENTPVHMKLHPESQVVFRYILERAPESVSNPHYSNVVQPRTLMMTMYPDSEGVWQISTLRVSGMPIVKGKVEERKYFTDVTFSSPLDKDADEMPSWLREIALDHVNLMNRDEALRERQREAARKAAREMFSLASEDMADEMADAIFTAIRRVG